MAKAPLSRSLMLKQGARLTVDTALDVPPIASVTPPTFTSNPSIAGTPVAGQAVSSLTYTDGVVANGSISSRSYLLAGSAVAAAYVLQAADVGKTLVYRNDATGPGSNGPVFALSAAKTVGAAPAPSLSLSGAQTRAEGNSGSTTYAYVLTLVRDGSTAAFPFTWAVTGSGSNPADAADFGGTFPSGSGTFAAGETSKTITVLVAGDTAVENDEAFTLTVNATGLNTVTASGTITNDDSSVPVSPLGLVGNRTYESYSYLGTGGSTLTDRTVHYLFEAVGADNPMSVVYGNGAVATASSSPSGSGVETACSNDIVISVDVQYPVGTKIGSLSFNGSPSATMTGGTAVEIIGVYSGATIPAGALIAFVPTLVVGSATTGTRAGPPYSAVSGGNIEASALGDGPFTYGGSSVAGRKYFPKAIGALTTKKRFWFISDSRGTGQGGVATANGDSGEFAPSISNAYAYHNGGVPGDRADWFADASKSALRRARFARFGFGASAGDEQAITIINLGINDVRAGRTVANCLTNDSAIVALCKKAFVATMSPQSSGAWTLADLSDQTVPATDAVRTGVNDARRVAGYAGSAGFIEIADVAESSRNSGKWKADGTAAKWSADGLHQTTYGYDQIRVSGVVNSAIGILPLIIPSKPMTATFDGVEAPYDLRDGAYRVGSTTYPTIAAMVTAGIYTQATPGATTMQPGDQLVFPTPLTGTYTVRVEGTTGPSAAANGVAQTAISLEDAGSVITDEVFQLRRQYVASGANNRASILSYRGGSVQANYQDLVNTLNGNNAAVVMVGQAAPNLFRLSYGGTDPVNQTTTATPSTGLTRMIIGNQSDGQRPWTGTVTRVTIYLAAFAPTQISALSSYPFNGIVGGAYTGNMQPMGQQYGNKVYYGQSKSNNQSIVEIDVDTKVMTGVFNVSKAYSGNDDHRSPAIKKTPSGKFFTAYTGHGDDSIFRYRRSTDDSFRNLGAEVQLSTAGIGVASYGMIYNQASTGHMIMICRTSTLKWSFFKSTDDGVTFSAAKVLTTHPSKQSYIYGEWASANRLRFFANENSALEATLRIFEWDVVTGDIYAANNVVIGNSETGGANFDDMTIFRPYTNGRSSQIMCFGANANQALYAQLDDLNEKCRQLALYLPAGKDAFTPTDWVSTILSPEYTGASDQRRFNGQATFSYRTDLAMPRVYDAIRDGTNWQIRQLDATAVDFSTFTSKVLRTVPDTNYNAAMRPRSPYGSDGRLDLAWQEGPYPNYSDWDPNTVGRRWAI